MKGLELHDLQIIFIIFWYERVTFILHDVPFHMYTTVFLPNKCLSTSVHLHFLPPTPTSSLICFLVLLYPLILFSSQSNPYKQVIIKQRYDYVKLQFKCLQWLPTAFRIKCPKRQPARPYMTTPGHHSSLTSLSFFPPTTALQIHGFHLISRIHWTLSYFQNIAYALSSARLTFSTVSMWSSFYSLSFS